MRNFFLVMRYAWSNMGTKPLRCGTENSISLPFKSSFVMEYGDLVAARKKCRICVERDPGKLRNGAEYIFDPSVVSHWSQWLGQQTPELLIVGQDFANVEYFEKYQASDDPRNRTNENLRKLLSIADVKVGMPPERDEFATVYLTNAILCMKEGRMNASIKSRWIDSCAETHLLPLTSHLKAPIVVGMGAAGWRAVRKIFKLAEAPLQISVAAGAMWKAANDVRIFPVGHCGPLARISHG